MSGKDLIQNHLTFSIYNHTAIFTPDRWPRAMRCNGHLLLNNAKMSKSTGNFKTLEQAILEFGADAMRFALADAGDTLDDANFLDETANAAILKLTKELAWVEETLAAGGDKGTALRAGDASSFTFADRVFSNELDVACVRTAAAYEAMQFREAVKCGFYDLQNARDVYRVMAASDGLNAGLVRRFIEVQTKLIAPICPHLAEHIWSEVLKKDGSVLKSGWPAAAAPDLVLRRAAQHLQDCITDWRKSMVKATAPAKGGKGGAAPAAPQKVVKLEVFVAERYGGWQEVVLGILESAYDAAANSFPPDGQLLDKVKASPLAGEADFKTVLKQARRRMSRFFALAPCRLRHCLVCCALRFVIGPRDRRSPPRASPRFLPAGDAVPQIQDGRGEGRRGPGGAQGAPALRREGALPEQRGVHPQVAHAGGAGGGAPGGVRGGRGGARGGEGGPGDAGEARGALRHGGGVKRKEQCMPAGLRGARIRRPTS